MLGPRTIVTEKLRLTVTVERDMKDSTAELTRALESQGFEVSRVSRRAGAIFGNADADRLDDLRSVSEIHEIRPERSFALPPLSEKIPQ